MTAEADSPERYDVGVIDTSVYLDLAVLDPDVLPVEVELTAITMAELHHGVAMARDAVVRAARQEALADAIATFDPLAFDDRAAAKYGSLVALTMAGGRSPRPRRLDLMIAATAAAHDRPLFTRNPRDFIGLEPAVTVIAV